METRPAEKSSLSSLTSLLARPASSSMTAPGFRKATGSEYLPHGIGAWLGIGALLQVLTGGIGSLFSFWGIVHVLLGPIALIFALFGLIKLIAICGVIGGGAWLAWKFFGK